MHPKCDGGFGLIEAVVSAGILIVIVSGLAHVAGLAFAATHAASRDTRAMLLAVEKLEQLQGAEYGSLMPTASGTLDRNVTGAVDFLDRRGRSLGTGGSLPGGTVHVRRWAIRPLGSTASDLLILQVVVIPHRMALLVSPGLTAAEPGVVWLTTLRGRR